MWSPNIIHKMSLHIPPVHNYLKAYMFQHAMLGSVMDSWCDRSGTICFWHIGEGPWVSSSSCIGAIYRTPFLPVLAFFSISPVYLLSSGDTIYSFREPHPPNKKSYLIVELYWNVTVLITHDIDPNNFTTRLDWPLVNSIYLLLCKSASPQTHFPVLDTDLQMGVEHKRNINYTIILVLIEDNIKILDDKKDFIVNVTSPHHGCSSRVSVWTCVPNQLADGKLETGNLHCLWECALALGTGAFPWLQKGQEKTCDDENVLIWHYTSH